MGSTAKNSVTVTIFNICGTLLVFLSNIVIAYKFGAGKEMDIYFASTTIPFFIMTILSMTLSFTFIPVFTEYDRNARDDKWEIVSSFINSALVLSIIICAAGMIFSRRITAIITPGFTPVKIEEAAALMRLLLPAVIFNVLNELLASIYYSHNRFMTPSLNKVLNPAVTILYILIFGSFLSTKSLALATLSAFFIQSVFLVGGVLRHRDFNYTLSINFRHPEVIKIFKLMLPLIAAMLITKAMPLTDRFFLSKLNDGSISYVSYAYRMILRIIDTVASGLVIALFPVMALHAASLNYESLYQKIMKGVKMLFFLVIPFVVIFFFYGEPMIRFLFERGRFTSSDTVATFRAFSLYLLSLPASIIGGIFYKGFYSIKQNKTVAIISASVMSAYILMCFLLLRRFDYLAIPISHAICFNISMIISGFLLRAYLDIKVSYSLLPELVKNAFSAAISALSIWPLMIFSKNNPVIYLLSCGCGFLIYFILSKTVFCTEASDIIWAHMASYKRKYFSRSYR